MSIWTPPPWASLVAGKAWTAAKARAAFENLLALAEAAAGAPRVSVLALAPGGRKLPIITGVTGAWVSILNLDAVGELGGWLNASLTAGAGGAVEVALSSDNGASWAASATLHSESGAWSAQGLFGCNLVTGDLDWIVGGGVNAPLPAGPVNAFRIRVTNVGSHTYQPLIEAGKP